MGEAGKEDRHKTARGGAAEPGRKARPAAGKLARKAQTGAAKQGHARKVRAAAVQQAKSRKESAPLAETRPLGAAPILTQKRRPQRSTVAGPSARHRNRADRSAHTSDLTKRDSERGLLTNRGSRRALGARSHSRHCERRPSVTWGWIQATRAGPLQGHRFLDHGPSARSRSLRLALLQAAGRGLNHRHATQGSIRGLP